MHRHVEFVAVAADQNDMLARYLAHELSCALLRETSGDYIIPAEMSGESVDRFDNTIELVSNNIAANDAIELTSDARTANAEISGKAHQIDDQLFQYWLTVTPNGKDSGLSSLSVSAYVLKPDARNARNAPTRIDRLGDGHEYVVPVRTTVAMPNKQRGALIGQSSFSGDAVVFYIQNQPHFGLVRLDSGVCRDRTMALVVRAGDPIRFPVTYAHTFNSETIDTDKWYVTPLRDTYYAIAISDEKAARRIANHLDQLPIRCGASARRGLSGQALHEWLDEFAAISAASAQHIDWRAVEIKDLL